MHHILNGFPAVWSLNIHIFPYSLYTNLTVLMHSLPQTWLPKPSSTPGVESSHCDVTQMQRFDFNLHLWFWVGLMVIWVVSPTDDLFSSHVTLRVRKGWHILNCQLSSRNSSTWIGCKTINDKQTLGLSGSIEALTRTEGKKKELPLHVLWQSTLWVKSL